MPTRVTSGGPLGWIRTVTGGSPGRFMDVARGVGASGPVCPPSGSGDLVRVRVLRSQCGLSTCLLGLMTIPPSVIRGWRWRPAVARPAVVTVRAAAAQLSAMGAVPMGRALGGRANPFTLHRIAGVLPVGQPAQVAADVAIAVGLESVECGHCVLAVLDGLVDDDLVVAAQRLQRAAGAGVVHRARNVSGPEGPPPNRHDQLDVRATIQLGLELLSGDRLHRSLLSSGMTYPDDPLTWRAVSAVHHRQAVTRSTVACRSERPARTAGWPVHAGSHDHPWRGRT